MKTCFFRFQLIALLFIGFMIPKEGMAMTHEDWQQVWNGDKIGFHRSDVNPLLIQYWPTLSAGQDEAVLVPLSGKSMDLVWLAQRHSSVYGSELIECAVASFFSENGLQPKRQTTEEHHWWQANNLTVIEGDFFTIPAESIDATVFYDRASLVALAEDQRSGYVAALMGMAPALKHGLLITLEYDPILAGGPPYSVSPSDVEALYGEHFEIKSLGSAPPERIPARMASLNTSSLVEHVFLLIRKTTQGESAKTL